ncbi:hypothetical protein MKX01_026262 [Papaver californicum]|nr:hypothetical protein MKX01_026262 [Papaver californicum]
MYYVPTLRNHQWLHKYYGTSKSVPCSTYKTFNQLTDMVEGEVLYTRAMISRTWYEVDFMGTNEVTSLDLLTLDEHRYQLHGVIPKKLIWKFEPLLREGVTYSLPKLNVARKEKNSPC